MSTSRAAGLVLGVLADAVWGDPRRGHPVAAFGRWAGWVERHTYADSRSAGLAHLTATLAPLVGAAAVAGRLAGRSWLADALFTAATTWAALGARSLILEGGTMADRLEDGDLAAARDQLPHLCGREPDGLSEEELARATVESLAENTNDAVVCTLWWGAVAGVPGIVLHRAANTLDAMVGHRSPRYARFGTPSAVADDLLAWLPARITAVTAVALAGAVGGDARRAWAVVRRDARRHPSPNGGWCEAAWAGVLGVTLGGRNVYAGRVEDRGLLGDGPRPDAGATRRAARLVAAVTMATSVAAAGTAWVGSHR